MLDAAKLKELGLDAPKRKLEITTRTETREFQIGSPDPGTNDPYLRDVKDGTVYVFGSSTVGDLDNAAQRLMERTLHGFAPADIELITVATVGDNVKSRTFSAKPGATQMSLKLTPQKGDKPDDAAGAWHDKLWRLLGTDIMGKGEEPQSGKPVLALRVDYKDKFELD